MSPERGNLKCSFVFFFGGGVGVGGTADGLGWVGMGGDGWRRGGDGVGMGEDGEGARVTFSGE